MRNQRYEAYERGKIAIGVGYVKTIMMILAVSAALIFFTPLAADAGYESIETCTTFSSQGQDAFLGEYYTLDINNATKQLTINAQTRTNYKALMFQVYKITRDDTGAGSSKVVLKPVYQLYGTTYNCSMDISALAQEGETYTIRPCFADMTANTSTGYNFPVGKFQFVGAIMRYSQGKFYFLRYPEIEAQNAQVRELGSKVLVENYLDVYLRDSWDAEYGLTEQQKQFIVGFANRLVAESHATTDYEKLIVFHDFITQNTYYDSVARNDAEIKAETHPYHMLKQYTEEGRMKSVCNGMSVLFMAFARSQKIPTRTADGYDVIYPNKSWELDIDYQEVNHVWNESYIDADGDGQKEWIVIDCTSDCTNKYTAADGYLAPTYPVYRYSLFNPSEQLLAFTHLCKRYRETDGIYMQAKISDRQCVDGAIQLTWELFYKPGGGVVLTQEQKDNVAGYVLYRKTDKTDWKELRRFYTKEKIYQYTDTTVERGVRYYYRLAVIAETDGSVGFKYNYRTAYAMTTPTIKTANGWGAYTYLQWNKIKGASKYYIYQKIDDPFSTFDDNMPYERIATVSSKYNYYRAYMDDANSGDNVSYKVVAVKTLDGTTYKSSQSAVKTVVKVGACQLKLLDNNISNGSTQINFTGVRGATGYAIYRARSQNGTYTQVGTVEAQGSLMGISEMNMTYCYEDRTVNYDTGYWYKVRAICNQDGKISYGQYSAKKKIVTLSMDELEPEDPVWGEETP